MTAAVIVYILIVTLPLVGAAALTEQTCRLWSLPVRGAWAGTALLIALIGGRTIAQQVVSSSAASNVTPLTVVQFPVSTSESRMASAELIASELVSLPRAAANFTAHALGPAQSRVLATLWCLMSAAMLALTGFVYTHVRRARGAWKMVEFVGQQVRVAPHAGPAVVGLLHPDIVIPRWALEAGPEDSRLILMHEMEHRAARDPLLLAAMWGLVVLIPWHPGAWYCLARARLAIELDCDARVVARSASLRTYAQLLVTQARVRLGAPLHLWLGTTSLLEPSSHLERRLRAMMLPSNYTPGRRSLARYARTLSYLVIISTVAIAACESHVPTAADISGLDTASTVRNARSASILTAQPVTYYSDDAMISVDSANTISAADISSITVNKRGPQEVRITTVQRSLPARPLDTAAAGHNPGKTFTIHVIKGTRPQGQAAIDEKPFSGAVVIDGVASDLAGMKSVSPSQIASIEVVKGAAAVARSTDPRAGKGLIIITLKH